MKKKIAIDLCMSDIEIEGKDESEIEDKAKALIRRMTESESINKDCIKIMVSEYDNGDGKHLTLNNYLDELNVTKFDAESGYLDWFSISREYIMSENLIRKYQNDVCWNWIALNNNKGLYHFTKKFRDEFHNRIYRGYPVESYRRYNPVFNNTVNTPRDYPGGTLNEIFQKIANSFPNISMKSLKVAIYTLAMAAKYVNNNRFIPSMQKAKYLVNLFTILHKKYNVDFNLLRNICKYTGILIEGFDMENIVENTDLPCISDVSFREVLSRTGLDNSFANHQIKYDIKELVITIDILKIIESQFKIRISKKGALRNALLYLIYCSRWICNNLDTMNIDIIKDVLEKGLKVPPIIIKLMVSGYKGEDIDIAANKVAKEIDIQDDDKMMPRDQNGNLVPLSPYINQVLKNWGKILDPKDPRFESLLEDMSKYTGIPIDELKNNCEIVSMPPKLMKPGMLPPGIMGGEIGHPTNDISEDSVDKALEEKITTDDSFRNIYGMSVNALSESHWKDLSRNLNLSKEFIFNHEDKIYFDELLYNPHFNDLMKDDKFFDEYIGKFNEIKRQKTLENNGKDLVKVNLNDLLRGL